MSAQRYCRTPDDERAANAVMKYRHSAITASLARNKSSNGVLQSLESVDIAG